MNSRLALVEGWQEQQSQEGEEEIDSSSSFSVNTFFQSLYFRQLYFPKDRLVRILLIKVISTETNIYIKYIYYSFVDGEKSIELIFQ